MIRPEKKGKGVKANLNAIEITVGINKPGQKILFMRAKRGRGGRKTVSVSEVVTGRTTSQAEVVERNKKTMWVRLPDGNVVKRKIKRDLV